MTFHTATLVRWLSRRTSGRDLIPEIDGLRSIAILGVILFHSAAAFAARTGKGLDGGAIDAVLARLLSSGEYGVPMFFTISGFILALPFAQHHMEGSAAPSLRRYFLRRVTRLEPPYLVFLATRLAIALARGAGAAVIPHFLASCIYQHGTIYHQPPAIGFIAWSLEVEVQFYILAPLLAMVFMIRSAALRRGLLGLAILADSWWFGVQTPMDGLYLHNHLAYFLAGLLLADLYLTDLRHEPPARAVWEGVALLALPAVFVCRAYGWAPQLVSPWLILVGYYAVFRTVRVRGFFRATPVVILGGMCYSLYLWHFSMIAAFAAALFRVVQPGPGWVSRLAFVVGASLAAIVAGAVMFALVERPTMDSRWPSKLATIFARGFGRRGETPTDDPKAPDR